MTVEEVASALGVTVPTVLSRIASGELPSINLSNGKRPTWRISPADLRAYVEARKARAEATR